jgi:hypothetical protein
MHEVRFQNSSQPPLRCRSWIPNCGGIARAVPRTASSSMSVDAERPPRPKYVLRGIMMAMSRGNGCRNQQIMINIIGCRNQQIMINMFISKRYTERYGRFRSKTAVTKVFSGHSYLYQQFNQLRPTPTVVAVLSSHFRRAVQLSPAC